MGVLQVWLHLVWLYGGPFAAGLIGGAGAVTALRSRRLRLAATAVSLVVLLLVSADAAFAFDIAAAVKSAALWFAAHPAPIPGAVIGAGVAALLWRRRARQQSVVPPARRTALRTVVLAGAVGGMIALEVLAPRLLDAALGSPLLNLPDIDLVKSTLTHCQIDHYPVQSGGDDVLLCPTEIAPTGFSSWLRKTVIASEDRNFLYHGAVDVHGTLRAGLASLKGNLEGGSTITQQLARILFLERSQTLRKAYEVVLAQRIFDAATQDEILDAYLNVAPLPRNMYGFDDAARFYFGVKAADLSLAESALLVGMLPNPNGRDISGGKDRGERSLHQKRALDAASRILAAMVADGAASPRDAKKAIGDLRTRLASGKLRRGSLMPARIEFRPFRDEAIAEAQAHNISLGNSYRLLIEMDPALQASVVAATATMATAHQGAGFIMRPTGEVLALSGSRVYEGAWNRAVTMQRSVGSAGKIFPLIALQQAGLNMDTRISTAPLTHDGWPREPDSACTASSTIVLAKALAHSCNRPFVRLTERYSSQVEALLTQFGFPVGPDVSLTPIGGLQTSPAGLARTYAAIGNNGLLPDPQYLIAAIGATGRVLFTGTPAAPVRVVKPAIAAAVLSDLRIPVKSGTAVAANSKYATVYGKTGTSSDAEDSVFVGIVKDFVGAFWLGDDSPQAISGAHGGGAPAAAFRQVVDGYYRAMPPEKTDAENADVSWFNGQLFMRAVIQYAAAAGFFSIISSYIVQYLFRRQGAEAAKDPADTEPTESG